MPAFEKVRSTTQVAAKRIMLAEAGDALTAWILEQGITADELARRLDAGELTLEAALMGALAQASPRDVAQARARYGAVVATVTEQDYPKVLQRVSVYAECLPHAKMLYQSHYYHRYFKPAMNQLRDWFLGG